MTFARRLAALTPASDPRHRRWVFVPYDQLSDRLGPIARIPADELGIVLVECPEKAKRRPYHKQKLALLLTNLRHFALEQAARGVHVRHVVAPGDYASALGPLIAELGPLVAMTPAERELRADLEPLVRRGQLELVPHEGWLTSRAQFERACGAEPPYRMDAFYRRVRLDTGWLVERGRPVGGKWSLDASNRRPWRGSPPAPAPPRFEPDAITLEVVDLIQRRFGDHPGAVDPSSLPATAEDAERAWAFALSSCLEHFGPFEDAMSVRSTTLFHTRISALLNLHRLLPRRVVEDALAADLPLASKEGFVRQVLGWREYVRHVHEATDGFRTIAPDGSPNALDAREPLPAAFWGRARSGLACLDRVVTDVWREAYGHHITRLMVLSNVATLLGVEPRALTDWFWVAYADAFDWVVEPNVLGMGTFATGDAMTTKPYVSGAAYLTKMSDYCGTCAFDPRSDCPLTPMYWDFLRRNDGTLRDNQRLALPLASARKRSLDQVRRDEQVTAIVRTRLRDGLPVTPGDLP